jgi:hypothetical protein
VTTQFDPVGERTGTERPAGLSNAAGGRGLFADPEYLALAPGSRQSNSPQRPVGPEAQVQPSSGKREVSNELAT